jgi:choline dehydrogenase-like flavoprotein
VDGIKIARKIAATAPFSQWLKREVAPGRAIQSDEDISAYARQAAHTVYHIASTCKMGAVDDEMAVVDPELRVRKLDKLRIVDASIFPVIVSANPMITVLICAERASDLILADYYRKVKHSAAASSKL